MNNNDQIIAIIKEQMKLKKLSSNELARRVGVAKSAMSRYLNLNREFPLNKVNEFSKALDLSPEYILGFDNRHIETHNIPVVSKISAGEPIHAEENIESYIAIPNAKENTFGLIVSGDSMDKEFKDGDIVIVEKDAVVENGQIGVVHINGYNATVKRIKYNDDDIILIPESNNNEHIPKIFN
ncbi:MAG TPA: helix-turn-helix domain-containing protein, partial [Candidatus Nosocomiicoccus stercorigallinarum]|nr:helix-turn-helix domain-containing protein [Candidatus Nosocomiicoccus stercorigallinarum]